jgi:hypothetical protein
MGVPTVWPLALIAGVARTAAWLERTNKMSSAPSSIDADAI